MKLKSKLESLEIEYNNIKKLYDSGCRPASLKITLEMLRIEIDTLKKIIGDDNE